MPYINADQTIFQEGDKLHFTGSRWIRRGHFASGALTAGVANAFAFNWQNPHANKLLITRVLIRITTAGGTAGSLLDVGVAAATATPSDNLIDGADLNAAAPVLYDNFGDPGANGKFKQIVDENGGANDWVTGQILIANAGALVGKYFIEYIEILP